MGPKGVSVDQNGHVIVVDNKACTVFIFQPSGKLVTKFGSRGIGDRQFAGRCLSTAVKKKGCRLLCNRQMKILFKHVMLSFYGSVSLPYLSMQAHTLQQSTTTMK